MEKIITVLNEEGLHARPAAVLVKKASSFTSDILLKVGDKEVNAKSLMSVMTLGLKKEAQIQVIAKGDDAEKALNELSELAQNKFGL